MKRKIYDDEGHAYFVTFSCYKRRKILSRDRAKAIVISMFASELAKQGGVCMGFVIMPDHVHAVIRFNENGRLSAFMKIWKQRSSFHLKRFMKEECIYAKTGIPTDEPIWQARYYCFNIYSEKKLLEKLDYMHNNPVKSGFVQTPHEWKFSSSGHYMLNKSVGVKIGF